MPSASSSQRPTKEEDEQRYNPDQDPEEKRRIRDGYRDQLKELEDHAKDFKNLDVSRLVEGVQLADRSFDGVRAPQEAILDSRLLTTVSTLSAAKARDFKQDGGGFDTDDFIARMVTFLGGSRMELNEEGEEDEDRDIELRWEKLGWKALQRSRRAPGLEFMLGALNLEQKKRVQNKRAKAEKMTGPEVKPHEVTAAEVNNAEPTAADLDLVAELCNLLDAEGPISVFELCINPESFAQSVENFFYLSFLIKDGKAGVDLSEEGELVCYIPDELPEMVNKYAKRQGVWQLDIATWKAAIATYNITTAKFKARPVPEEHTYAFYGS